MEKLLERCWGGLKSTARASVRSRWLSASSSTVRSAETQLLFLLSRALSGRAAPQSEASRWARPALTVAFRFWYSVWIYFSATVRLFNNKRLLWSTLMRYFKPCRSAWRRALQYVTPVSRRSLSRCWSYYTQRALVHINTEPLSPLSWYIPRNSRAALAGQGPLLWAPSHGQQRIDNIWMRVSFMFITKAVSGGMLIMGKILAAEFTQITRAVMRDV